MRGVLAWGVFVQGGKVKTKLDSIGNINVTKPVVSRLGRCVLSLGTLLACLLGSDNRSGRCE